MYAGVFVLTLVSATAGFYLFMYQANPIQSDNYLTGGVNFSDEQKKIVGQQRPDFSLMDVTGAARQINEWDGRVIAINFWATWCPPCLKEIPSFIALQNKYADEGLQFIGIALQKPEEVTDFIRTQGMNYPVLVGELEVVELAKIYGNKIGALPYTVIIDRLGRISFVKYGELAGETAEEVIKRLL